MEELQYLTFYLGDEVFALDVLKIKEIIPYGEITSIPLMQPFLKGIMNIRGSVVPIVDLPKRVELDVDLYTKQLSIIIVSIDYENELSNVGIMVSRVDKVFSEEISKLESSPAFGSSIKKEWVKNIAKVEDEFIPILDIDKVLNLEDLSKTFQEI